MNPLFLFRKEITPVRKLLLMHIAAGGKLIEQTATGNPLTFVTDVVKPFLKLELSMLPVQSGTGDPSPTNIRPISGWTGVTAYHSGEDTSNPTTYPVTFPALGKNLFDFHGNGYYSNTGSYSSGGNSACSEKIPVSPGEKYTFGAVNHGGITVMLRGYCFNSSGAIVGGLISGGDSVTTTIPEGAETVAFWCGATGYTPMTEQDCVTLGIQVVKGETLGTYEPYTNTLYGGTLDLTTGVLTATHKMFTKNTADMNRNNADYPGWNNCGIKDVIGAGVNKTIYATEGNMINCGIRIGVNTDGANDSAYLARSAYGLTEDEWKALAMDYQFLYKLPEPVVIATLAPQQVQTLIGTNTVWSNANGDCEVTYLKKG